MTDIHLYGIANCDTMKKARKNLQARDISYCFHDYRKEGINVAMLSAWAERVGWEKLLNRRGMTWRKLSEDARADLDEAKAIALMCEYPAMIKRPVLIAGEIIEVGFSERRYEELLA